MREGAGISENRGPVVHYGLNHVTSMVESKRAKMVCIASDVDPIELVLWLPALCRRMGVPFCIVKNRSRPHASLLSLRKVVANPWCTCLAAQSTSNIYNRTRTLHVATFLSNIPPSPLHAIAIGIKLHS